MQITCPSCKSATEYEWQYDAPDDEFVVLECPTCGIDWRHTADEDVRVYWYVNRWRDESGTAHYFGVQTTASTIDEAQRSVQFNAIATAVDLVYAADNLTDLHEYLGDVSANQSDDDPGQMWGLTG